MVKLCRRYGRCPQTSSAAANTISMKAGEGKMMASCTRWCARKAGYVALSAVSNTMSVNAGEWRRLPSSGFFTAARAADGRCPASLVVSNQNRSRWNGYVGSGSRRRVYPASNPAQSTGTPLTNSSPRLGEHLLPVVVAGAQGREPDGRFRDHRERPAR